jgi:uncharacterized delta-60 repeat protein
MIQCADRRSARRFAGVRANQITLLASLLACLLHVLLPTDLVRAQCTPGWLPGGGLPVVAGSSYAVAALPGGDIIVGGYFSTAGGSEAIGIARYNPATGAWSALGSGVSGFVYAIAALPNGDLIVGGSFTYAGSLLVNNIARYNPATGVWSALGSGMDNSVYDLAVLPSGDVIVGGYFTTAGGVAASRIARYNPATGVWSPLGSGVNGATSNVQSLAILPDGDLIVGGRFDLAGDLPANNIARYNPATEAWSALGSGVSGVTGAHSSVNTLAVLPGGDVVVGGSFTTAGGLPANRIARCNPASGEWSALGSGVNASARTLVVLPSGDVIAGGYFTTAGGLPANRIARYNLTTGEWSALGSGVSGIVDPFIYELAVLPDGNIITCGYFNTAGGLSANGIARYNPGDGSWSALGGGVGVSNFNSVVTSLMVLQGGDVIVGGSFSVAGGNSANRIVRLNGSAHSPLGTGIGDNFTTVRALTTLLPNGDIIAGGDFTTAGGLPARYIARWNGSTWSPFGTGLIGGGGIYALATLPNGDLIAGGNFSTDGGVTRSGIARWNGSAWSPLGTGVGLVGTVYALTTLPNGDLIAGGQFEFTTSVGWRVWNIARWNGSAWSPLRTGQSPDSGVTVLKTLPNGDLIAGGSFSTIGSVQARSIARWNGSTWSPLGTGLAGSFTNVSALTTLPNGDLVVGGRFTTAGGVPVNNISRWNGSAWSTLGTGITGGGSYPSVNALATLPNGDLIAGGAFYTAGGNPSAYFARYTFGSPADVAGPGQSPGSDNALTADDIIVYLNWFFASDTRADVAGPGQSTTPDTQFTADDIIVFLNRFFAGC